VCYLVATLVHLADHSGDTTRYPLNLNLTSPHLLLCHAVLNSKSVASAINLPRLARTLINVSLVALLKSILIHDETKFISV
jgi:hypothetical protein